MIQKLNILIADDHDYYLDGLQADIENIKYIDKIYRAKNGYEILEIIEKTKIDILITDIQMPKLDGISAVTKIKNIKPELKIIFLTSYYDIQHIKPLFKLDIKVILDKENVKKEINEALKSVLNNKTYYTALISETINDLLKGKRKTKDNKVIKELTRREKEVFPYLAQGMTNEEIAEKLCLSPKTIDSHRVNIYFKFKVKSAAKFVAKVYELGLIE